MAAPKSTPSCHVQYGHAVHDAVCNAAFDNFLIKTHYISQRASSSSLPSALLSPVVAQPTHKAVSCDVPFIARVAKHPHTLVDQPSRTAVSCEVSLILRVAKHSHTHTHTAPLLLPRGWHWSLSFRGLCPTLDQPLQGWLL